MSLVAIESIWEYQTVANTVPVDPATEVVPVAGWTPSALSPFGEGTLGNEFVQPNTVWARNTGLWIRRGVTVNGQAPLVITGRCEQAMYLYFDGIYAGTLNPTNSSRADIPRYNVVIPKSLAITGTHELALLCLDDNSLTGVSYISVEADYAPAILALQPEAPVTEKLAWFTDLIVSKDGSEQRWQIAPEPRQEFNYTFPATDKRKVLAFNTVWGALSKEWLVPVWSQAQDYGVISAGLTTLPDVVLDSELRAPGLALLWQNDTEWQIIGFDSLSGDDLLLNTLTQAFSDAWLIPLRTGFMRENSVRKLNGYETTFDLSFTVLDNAALTVAAPAQYLGEDLYTVPTLFKGDELSDDMLSNIDLFDPMVGPVAFYQNWDHSKIARTYRVVCEGPAEAWELREFLHRRAGRFRAFWQPTFENDLRLESTGTIVSTVNIVKDDFIRYATDRTHIAIQAAGVWYPRAITLITEVDDDTVQLTLSSALNVAADRISCISWLGLKRLNTDQVEIRYIGNGVAEAEFRILEVSP
jgi:hypothetical protein